jgi:hypothetical protein
MLRSKPFKRAMLAAVCLLWVCAACPAFADEPFPNWDINLSALEDSNEAVNSAPLSLKRATDDPHPNEATARTIKDELEVIKSGPEVMFNRYLAWHTSARNYLANHWPEYSEYTKLSCIKNTVETAVYWSTRDHWDGSTHPAVTPIPSYVQLLMCVPVGEDEWLRMMSKNPS